MELSERLWRWVAWSYSVKLTFLGLGKDNRDSRVLDMMVSGTTLCHAARLVFFWMPLAVITNLATWAFLIVSVTYVPWSLFGTAGYAGFVIGCAFFGTIAYWLYRTAGRRYDRFEDRVTAGFSALAEVTHIASLFLLFARFIIAVKRKVCPVITPQKGISS